MMDETTKLFKEHMVKHGVMWMEDQGVISSDPKQLFWVAGAAPIIQQGLRSYEHNLASSQTCLRMNSFESIGITEGRHICFPMLGHFSMFQHDPKAARKWAIESAWYFLTEKLGLDPESLVISRHNDDEMTATVWRSVGVTDEKMELCREKHTAEFIPGAFGYRTKIGLRTKESIAYFWDIVFVDVFKKEMSVPEGKILVDSGMSLDRLLSVTEGKSNSYTTMRWNSLITAIRKCHISNLSQSEYFRLADVGRAASILLLSGLKPSTKKHSYVLRKLLREIVGITDSYFEIKTFQGIMVECLTDATLWYDEHLHIVDLSEALTTSLEEHKRYSETVTSALRRQENILAQKGELAAQDREELTGTFGLPVRLLR